MWQIQSTWRSHCRRTGYKIKDPLQVTITQGKRICQESSKVAGEMNSGSGGRSSCPLYYRELQRSKIKHLRLEKSYERLLTLNVDLPTDGQHLCLRKMGGRVSQEMNKISKELWSFLLKSMGSRLRNFERPGRQGVKKEGLKRMEVGSSNFSENILGKGSPTD